MFGKKPVVALGAFALALALSSGVTSVQAAACKGLEMGACQENGDCSWVKPYERKDGVKVAGYCKSKPKRSGKSGDTKKSESTNSKESKMKKSESKE
jgi:hypothetical protein